MYRFLLVADERSALQALISVPCCHLPKSCLHLKSRFVCLCNYTVFLWNEVLCLYFYFLSLSDFFFFPWSICCFFTWNEDCAKLNFFFSFLGSYSFENNWSADWGAALKECCCLFLWRQLHICVLKFFQSLLLTREAENTEPAKFSF